MDLKDNRAIDWTGVQPDDSPIEPLNARTFVLRLRRLEEWVSDLRRLRQAMPAPPSPEGFRAPPPRRAP